MFRLAYIVTHPIQYQAPLLHYLSHAGGIDLRVFFLSDFSLHQHYEQAFHQTFKWDVALTEGYKWEILPRIFLGPSTKLRRWWPVARLRQRLGAGYFDAVWVHGWAHLGLCQVIQDAASLALPVLLRGESTPESNRRSAVRRCIRDPFSIGSMAFQKIDSSRCPTQSTMRSFRVAVQRRDRSAKHFACRSGCRRDGL